MAGVKAGVLALQGDFREHARMLAACGATPVLVRHPEELDDVQALCIPGGESTSIAKLAVAYGLVEPIRARARAGMPVFGTCAGMILLANRLDEGVPAAPVAHRHRGPAKRVRPPGGLLRGRGAGPRDRLCGLMRPSSVPRVVLPRSAPASTCWPTWRGVPVLVREPGNILAPRLGSGARRRPPRLPRARALPGRLSRRVRAFEVGLDQAQEGRGTTSGAGCMFVEAPARRGGGGARGRTETSTAT